MPPARRAVTEAAESGDRLATLRAVRDVLARLIDDPALPAREAAAVSGRLQSVLAEIAELAPPEQKGTALDELNARRAARGAAPARTSESRAGR